MRLTTEQIELIHKTAIELLGGSVRVRLFGSRLNDHLRGGDVDLMVEVNHAVANPAVISARLASRLSRAMNGRRVDVVLDAPNLISQPIHQVARQTGVLL